MASNKDTTIRIRQYKSAIGYDEKQRATLRGLGLSRMHQVVEVEDTPATRGMLNKVAYMVNVVEEA